MFEWDKKHGKFHSFSRCKNCGEQYGEHFGDLCPDEYRRKKRREKILSEKGFFPSSMPIIKRIKIIKKDFK